MLSRFLLLLALQLCSASPRVRRELRTLSDVEKHDLFGALWALKTTNQSAGNQLFGSAFRPYDYFVIKHAVAVTDSRGDQGHFGPSFMTYHRVFLLELEAALLAVLTHRNSTLDALPYWDASLDADTGSFYRNPAKSVFSPAWFGSYTGNASAQYVITDSAVSPWPIGHFDINLVPKENQQTVLTTYTGDPHIGNRLRGPSNLLDTEYTTRLPKTGFPTLDGHDDIVYTAEDFALCSDATWCPDWMTWQACVENAQVHQREMSGQFWNNASGLHWMHSQFHAKIGSYTGPWPANFPFMSNSTLLTMGDMMDVATSPNDPIFAFHHANVDRLNMQWQENVVCADPGASKPEHLFGFPRDYASWEAEWKREEAHKDLNAALIWRSAKDGCMLDDVVSSKFPFSGVLPGTGWHTHRDVLEHTLPHNRPYTYDTIAPAC